MCLIQSGRRILFSVSQGFKVPVPPVHMLAKWSFLVKHDAAEKHQSVHLVVRVVLNIV